MLPQLLKLLQQDIYTDAPEYRDRVDEVKHIVSEYIEFSKSPCGHSSQYAFTKDGGKKIVCLLCEDRAKSDVLKEFIADVHAAGIIQVSRDWPDLRVTYNKAKRVVKQ